MSVYDESNNITKNGKSSILSEQFKNRIEKSLAHKYMTAHFLGLVQAFQFEK